MVNGLGKKRRLARLFQNGKAVIVPIDDSLIIGPKNGLFEMSNTIEHIVKGKPSALMGFRGGLELVSDKDILMPFIFNLTASTVMSQHTKKTMIASVEYALKNGADCVACHVNFGSIYESDMIRNLAIISQECDKWGMPLLTIAYPRTEENGLDNNYEDLKKKDAEAYADIVAHAVRVSVELGSDIIKTMYTGTVESFKKVIIAANEKPVVVAGGARIPVAESLRTIEEVMEAGASGISYGRNVFDADNIESYMTAVKHIVFDGWKKQDCLDIL